MNYDGDLCAACSKGFRKREQAPPCVGCPHKCPELTVENQAFVWLLMKMSSSLTDGFDALNVSAIDLAMRAFGVPHGSKRIVYEKFLIYYSEMLKERKKKGDDDGRAQGQG